MLQTHKAAARLQAQWDLQNPGEARTIQKVIGTPKSSSAVGWTWAAIAADGSWVDLGYTELDAKRKIGAWNSDLSVAVRKLNEAMSALDAAVGLACNG